jgi:hypothetical protein
VEMSTREKLTEDKLDISPEVYPSWSVLEKAVAEEKSLQNEAAFEACKKDAAEMLVASDSARLRKTLWVLCILSIMLYFIIQIWREGDNARIIACFASAVVCIAAIVGLNKLWAKRRKRISRADRQNIIATRSVAAFLWIVGILLPLLLSYLNGLSSVKYFPPVSGVVSGLGVGDFTLLSVLVVFATYRVIGLVQIWTRDQGVLLFDRLARLAKRVSDFDRLGHGEFRVKFSDQIMLCELIEQAARAIDIMSYTLASQSEDEVLRGAFAAAASGLRDLKREVVFPDATYEKLTEQTCKLCMISATGLYGLFPTGSAKEASARPRGIAKIALLGKQIGVAIAPLAVYLIVTVFHIVPEQSLPSLGIGSLLWLLAYVLKALDPNYSTVLDSMKTMAETRSDFSGTSSS